ncbi:MAG TPA: hypothetical protein VFG42_04040 [Baekduia sp.]|uniref:hypothetical protein n=1 Tax=Baekduia sp. TaxID=2600305 RepID=UPI002D77A585|nr:hypothetical protein [Baekduia sp.]HET6505935.1 hypothetical protein [Baekduia sp.]
MLRRVCLMMVLALLGGAVPAAAQAKGKPAPKRCPEGQVRVTAKAPCVRPSAKRATAVPASLARDARVRKLAGKKLYARVRKLRPALLAKLQAKRTGARAAAVEGGTWEPATYDGKPGRSRSLTDISDEHGVQRRRTAVDVELTLSGDGGAQATLLVQEKMDWDSVSCPDANGVATADVAWTHTERTTVRRRDDSAFTETRMTRRAKVRVQVGDDAEIASATYAGTIDLESRGTAQGSVRYVMGWDTTAPLPGTATSGAAAAMGYAGTYRGPHGDRLTQTEVEMLLSVRAGLQDLVEQGLDDVLRTLRGYWTTNGQCVDLQVDPATATLADGGQATLTAKAHVVADGTPMTGAMEVEPLEGSVDDTHPRMVAGGPVAVRFTMGGTQDKTSVLFTVTGRRGRATAAVEITRPHGWDVTFTATGTYDQTRSASPGDDDVTSMALRWTTVFKNVYFDGGAFSPLSSTNMEGSVLTTKGTLGTGSYTCTGVPYPPSATIVPRPAGDGATTLTLTPFTAVVARPDDVDCERAGYEGEYGTVIGLQHAEPYAARVTITPAMLTRPDFVVPVTFDGAFPANCGEGPTVRCKDSGTMTGGVRFVRVS